MHPVKADFSSLVHDMSIYTCWMQLSLYCFLFSNVSSGSYPIIFIYVFPGGSDGKASAYNARDLGSIPGFGRFPWRKKWQPSPVLLPRKSNGRRILVGYSPWGHKESDMTEWLHSPTAWTGLPSSHVFYQQFQLKCQPTPLRDPPYPSNLEWNPQIPITCPV